MTLYRRSVGGWNKAGEVRAGNPNFASAMGPRESSDRSWARIPLAAPQELSPPFEAIVGKRELRTTSWVYVDARRNT